jgi:hypothetical protein
MPDAALLTQRHFASHPRLEKTGRTQRPGELHSRASYDPATATHAATAFVLRLYVTGAIPDLIGVTAPTPLSWGHHSPTFVGHLRIGA